jgi:NAD-dependent dihydropyrimidine dehydrogenase PreA subunit/sugar-specific transcriptional regulator TrmB
MTELSVYGRLAESVGAGGSSTVAEIFKSLADEDEAKLLMAAAPPATAEELSQKAGIPVERVEEMAGALYKKGLFFKSKKPGPTQYYRVRHIVQFHDSTAVALDLSPELIKLWREYMENEWEAYRESLMRVIPKPGLRVIPVNISIEPQTQIMAFDDVKSLIEASENIAVTPCACRAIERACESPLEVCLQLGRAAEYAVDRGTGKRLSKQEALDVLELCEEAGLVHCASNQRGPGHVICNCCDCCCMFWGKMGYVAPSRYRAIIDADLCTGCEICLERCHFNALSMNGGDSMTVGEDECRGCGLCLSACPEEALNLTLVRPEDFVPE